MVKDIDGNRLVGVKGWEANMLEDVNSLVWYKDKGMFYVKTENRRPCKLYYQELDTDPEILYENTDPSCWMDITMSKDKKFLMISLTNKSNSTLKCLKL
jgi:protease II